MAEKRTKEGRGGLGRRGCKGKKGSRREWRRVERRRRRRRSQEERERERRCKRRAGGKECSKLYGFLSSRFITVYFVLARECYCRGKFSVLKKLNSCPHNVFPAGIVAFLYRGILSCKPIITLRPGTYLFT